MSGNRMAGCGVVNSVKCVLNYPQTPEESE